jgi:hypothetical protein
MARDGDCGLRPDVPRMWRDKNPDAYKLMGVGGFVYHVAVEHLDVGSVTPVKPGACVSNEKSRTLQLKTATAHRSSGWMKPTKKHKELYQALDSKGGPSMPTPFAVASSIVRSFALPQGQSRPTKQTGNVKSSPPSALNLRFVQSAKLPDNRTRPSPDLEPIAIA